jgi:hypothetical protein
MSLDDEDDIIEDEAPIPVKKPPPPPSSPFEPITDYGDNEPAPTGDVHAASGGSSSGTDAKLQRIRNTSVKVALTANDAIVVPKVTAFQKYLNAQLEKKKQKRQEKANEEEEEEEEEEDVGDDSDKDPEYKRGNDGDDESSDEEEEEVEEVPVVVTKQNKKKNSAKKPAAIASDSSYRPGKDKKTEKQLRIEKKKVRDAAITRKQLPLAPRKPSPTKPAAEVVIDDDNEIPPSSAAQFNPHPYHDENSDQYWRSGGGSSWQPSDFTGLNDETAEPTMLLTGTALNSAVSELARSGNPDDFKFRVLLSVMTANHNQMMQRITETSNGVEDLYYQLRVVIGLKNQAQQFFVLKGTSEMFEQLVETISRFISFPMFHESQLIYLQDLLKEHPLLYFLIVIFVQSASMGGDVFMSARGVWGKLITDRLSRRIAWCGFGQMDEDGYARIGSNKKRMFMLRKACPDVRNLIYGKKT